MAADRWLLASAGSSSGVPLHEKPHVGGILQSETQEKARSKKSIVAKQEQWKNAKPYSPEANASLAMKQEQWRKIDEAYASGLRVVVDMSYAERMSKKERNSLGRQLAPCWAANKKADAPVQMHIAGLGSCPAECLPNGRFETLGSWRVHCHDCGVGDAFATDELIFLSPDADEVLTAPLDRERVYVIGGFVDSQIQRRVSLQKAQALGVQAVRLPLEEEAPKGVSNPRLPMSVNAVFEVLLALNAGQPWATTLGTTIPLRHQVAGPQQAGRKARRAAGLCGPSRMERSRTGRMKDHPGTAGKWRPNTPPSAKAESERQRVAME